MNDSQDDFSPMLVDQQIENPDILLSPADAHFIHDVRAMLEQEKNASIEQGWQRLVSQRADASQPSEILHFSTEKHHHKRISIMDEKTMLPTPTQPARKKRLPPLLGQIAAVLVCIVLVGSLVLILTVARNKPASSAVGSKGTQTNTATPVGTSTRTIPVACKDSSDLAEQTLCATGQETNVNITLSFTVNTYDTHGNKTSNSGTVNVTFHRAYADISRLILVYTINQQAANWGGFSTLSTNQGTLRASESAWQKGSFTQSFDTSSLPESTTPLHIQAIGTTFDGSVPLVFTLPFHTTSKIVEVKQTRTGKGYKLNLDHLVLTNSLVTFAFTLTYSQPTPPDVEVTALTLNGQKQAIILGDLGSGESDQPGILKEKLVLAQSFLGQPGSWTVTLSVRSTNPGLSTSLGEETFAFSVTS